MSFRDADGTFKPRDGDYAARTRTVAFNSRLVTRRIAIEDKCDGRKEADETLYMDLSSKCGDSWFAK